MIYAFEKLKVWQLSRTFVKNTYGLTGKYPAEEKYGLVSQLRRASVSVSSNIAEGSVRWSRKEQARFYEIAYGSLIEVLNQLILSNDLGFISDQELGEVRKQLDEVGRMLNALFANSKKG